MQVKSTSMGFQKLILTLELSITDVKLTETFYKHEF